MTADAFGRLSRVLSEPLLLVTADGRIVAANAAASSAFAASTGTLLGLGLQDVLGAAGTETRDFLRACASAAAPIEWTFARRGGAGGTDGVRVVGGRADDGALPAGTFLVRVDDGFSNREADLSDFFENAAVGVHSVDAAGVVRSVNRAELRMLGYDESEMVGHAVAEFHVEPNVAHRLLERLASGETLSNEEVQLRRKDGSICVALVSSNARFENGRFVHTRCFTRDITERSRNERSNAELAAIVASSDDAIIGKTLEGRIASWNAGAERLFGYTAEEALGKPVSMLAPPDRKDEMPRILAEIRAGRRVDHFDTVRMHKDGHLISISLTVSPIRNSAGRIIGASKIARDVSERKRIESEREALLESERVARAEAERANRLKDEFLATLSHELRTPLSAILGWSHLLRRDEMPAEERRKGLEVIERNARAQTQIIEDLLDLSRIVSGKLRLDVQRVNLSPVVDAALETIRPAAAAKDIQLHSVLDPFVGPVVGDMNRLQQVVWNLLSNAVKFTPKGGRVQISLERVNSHCEIVVSDTGIGIDPEFLPYVFERFRQADSSAARRHGGLGIGLAVVKNLVELHGGSVHVKSAGPGKGATFVVRLPVAVVQHAADEERTHPRVGPSKPVAWPEPKLAGIRVLVVDDDPDARDLVRRVLEENHADVLTAGSASEAFEIFRRERPTVLVSDIGMPEEDGYEFIQRIRSLEASEGATAARKVPALALTAFARSEDRTRALVAGYEMHVAKPVEPQELIASVAALARRND